MSMLSSFVTRVPRRRSTKRPSSTVRNRGTVVSTALEKMLEVARARYPTDRWNIYAAQASDGDNYGADSGRCVSLLGGEVLPICQYFAVCRGW